MRSAVTGVVAAIALVLALVSVAAPAGAHTDLLQGSPGPAQRVGGTVDFLDLVFVDVVTEAVITLEGPDGQLVDGTTVVSEGQILRYEMEPLTETGRYLVRFSMRSADGDDTQSGYFFDYDPTGFEPVRLGEVDIPNDNGRYIAIAASVVFFVAIIGLVMMFLSKLERDRAAKTPTTL
jgi:methionine-rich copper-binding protein CopC